MPSKGLSLSLFLSCSLRNAIVCRTIPPSKRSRERRETIKIHPSGICDLYGCVPQHYRSSLGQLRRLAPTKARGVGHQHMGREISPHDNKRNNESSAHAADGTTNTHTHHELAAKVKDTRQGGVSLCGSVRYVRCDSSHVWLIEHHRFQPLPPHANIDSKKDNRWHQRGHGLFLEPTILYPFYQVKNRVPPGFR